MLDVLLADDDPDVRESVGVALRCAGHRVTEATDGVDAVAILSDHVFDLAICDVCMPKLDGHTLLRRIRRESPSTSVVMMTSFATVSDVVGSLRDGAVNYLPKPFDVDEFIANVVAPLAERRSISRRFEEVRSQFVSRSTGATLVTKSPAMNNLAARITMLASSDAPVLITGDKGTGKELIARTIHARGSRRDGPFLVVEGSGLLAMMEVSVQQEMSDARGPRDAWFRTASSGTLVIDGIDLLPLRAQAELLRVIDEPVSRARRGPSWEPLGVRVISLSRQSLAERVLRGEFLDSLYYRINSIHLRVPALRERTEDLCPLVAELLRELSPPNTLPPGISPRAWNALSHYDFAGNVRELRWALERALLLSDGDEIDTVHLPEQLLGERAPLHGPG